MVRDNRIKSYSFPEFSVNGSVVPCQFTEHPINGEILDITFFNRQSAGSIFIFESGTSANILTRVETSGTSADRNIPVRLPVDELGGALGSLTSFREVTNTTLCLIGSNFSSGTGKTYGPIEIRYR